MSTKLSQDSQAILLLTAPLMAGRTESSPDLLTPVEYWRLEVFLREVQKQPGDLMAADAESVIGQCRAIIDGDRLKRLLGRGVLLSQAVERWQARAIWVITNADPTYPLRLKGRLKDNAPAVLYGCGDATILETGGLAVVGGRNATPALLTYAGHIGEFAAHAEQTVVSGGARGIGQASIHGALEAGGKAVSIVADNLERAALDREVRLPLMEGRLVLVSPSDPMAGCNVGNAIQCNRLIYALADAALVISSDYQKGGTWAGATEQLTNLRLVPVFVRSRGDIGKGLQELQDMGALPWPNPTSAAELVHVLMPEREPGTVAYDEEVVPKTKPVPAKRRSQPKKSAGNIAEPTLFDSASGATTSEGHTAMAHEGCETKIDVETRDCFCKRDP
ncbi:MAG: DNA-processing protein DprA, partial [Candidatus Cryosericum sp.]